MTRKLKVLWKHEIVKVTCIKTVNGVSLHYYEFITLIKTVNDIEI